MNLIGFYTFFDDTYWCDDGDDDDTYLKSRVSILSTSCDTTADPFPSLADDNDDADDGVSVDNPLVDSLMPQLRQHCCATDVWYKGAYFCPLHFACNQR